MISLRLKKNITEELTIAWKEDRAPDVTILTEIVNSCEQLLENLVYDYKDFQALTPEIQQEVKKVAAKTLFIQECVSWCGGEKNNNTDRAARTFYSLAFLFKNKPGYDIFSKNALEIYQSIYDACSGKIDGKLPELKECSQIGTLTLTRIAEHVYAALGKIMMEVASKNLDYYQEIVQSLQEDTADIRYPFKGNQWDSSNTIFVNYIQGNPSGDWNDAERCAIPMMFIMNQMILNYLTLALNNKPLTEHSSLDDNPSASEVSLLTPANDASVTMMLSSMAACRYQRLFAIESEFTDQVNQLGSLIQNCALSQVINDLIPRLFRNYSAWGQYYQTHFVEVLTRLFLTYKTTKDGMGPDFGWSVYYAFGFAQENQRLTSNVSNAEFSVYVTELQNNALFACPAYNAPVHYISTLWPIDDLRTILSTVLINVNNFVNSDIVASIKSMENEVCTTYAPNRCDTQCTPTAIKAQLESTLHALQASGDAAFPGNEWRSKMLVGLLKDSQAWLDSHYNHSCQQTSEQGNAHMCPIHTTEFMKSLFSDMQLLCACRELASKTNQQASGKPNEELACTQSCAAVAPMQHTV